jgi:hypothetical protein
LSISLLPKTNVLGSISHSSSFYFFRWFFIP